MKYFFAIFLVGQLFFGGITAFLAEKPASHHASSTAILSKSATRLESCNANDDSLDEEVYVQQSSPFPYLTKKTRWEINHFATPAHHQDSLEYILIPNGVIKDRIEKLAEDVFEQFDGHEVQFVCVLKGASIFFHDFLRAYMKLQQKKASKIKFDFIRVKSYSGLKSTGNVQILGADTHADDWRGKNVVFVEDIVDTGLTMSKLVEYMNDKVQPASVKVVTLLQKRIPEAQFTADFIGFSIPNVFVVGYGLDYNEEFRDMRHLCVLNQEGIDKYK